MRTLKYFFGMALAAFLWSSPAFAGSPAPTKGTTEAAEALQVKGQTRNVSMMAVQQAKKNNVRFVSARKNYQEQILTTPY